MQFANRFDLPLVLSISDFYEDAIPYLTNTKLLEPWAAFRQKVFNRQRIDNAQITDVGLGITCNDMQGNTCFCFYKTRQFITTFDSVNLNADYLYVELFQYTCLVKLGAEIKS